MALHETLAAARRLLTTITVDYSLSCAHEQKAHGGAVDGHVQQNAIFTMLVDLTKRFGA